MAFMHTTATISDADIRDADAIHTVDPHDSNAAGHQLWGHQSEKSVALPASGQKLVEIELPSDDHVALLALIDRIERIKGKLPPDVEVLRRNLSS
jgi:hypothetical protein